MVILLNLFILQSVAVSPREDKGQPIGFSVDLITFCDLFLSSMVKPVCNTLIISPLPPQSVNVLLCFLQFWCCICRPKHILKYSDGWRSCWCRSLWSSKKVFDMIQYQHFKAFCDHRCLIGGYIQ